MQLSYPKLAIPDQAEVLAFRAIDQILRSDDTLGRILVQYISWTGAYEDLFEPTLATCPYLRISPGGLGSSWETEGQHRMPMSIALSAAVVGSDFNQIGNLWGAIRKALFPPLDTAENQARNAYVKATTKGAGISRGILTAPSYGVAVDEKQAGARITRADGTLELVLLISTP